ncbi:MAG TPA: signal peptidase I [Candidatus Sulfotelmatobacter sp.]|nr:signal peptidase I [Candidatus Sulfotelmatobacter sp.]
MIRTKKLAINTTILLIIAVCLLVGLRIFGLVRLFSMAKNSEAPALSTGDHIVSEDFSFHWRNPRRGDIVMFKTDGLRFANAPLYAKRVIGLPGERVGITNGDVYINGALVVISNAYGSIRYLPIPSMAATDYKDNTLVPSGQYFVLGDNSTKSFDSRYFGCVPITNIIGRAWLCYWPPQRIGLVK